MHESASSQGDLLVAGAYRAEKIPQLVIGKTEPRRRGETLEAQHRADALFDAAMVLLEMVVEIIIRAMGHVLTELRGNGTGVGPNLG